MTGSVHYFRWPWEIITGLQAPETPGARPWSSSGFLWTPPGSTLALRTRNAQYLPMEAGRLCFFALPLASAAVSFDVAVPGSPEVSRWTLEPPELLAKIPQGKTFRDLELYDLILSWSTFFDECLEDGGKPASLWADIGRTLLRTGEDAKEPQMSLIVRIAREMRPTVSELSESVRSVLARERQMVPAGRTEEFDSASIGWLGRQPGQNLAEKAAYNRQKLKSVTRRQSFDTLENRVFKDFLLRCQKEARAYCRGCTLEERRSARAQDVDRFGKLCAMVLEKPLFEQIPPLRWGAVQPNYVLQSEPRYRKVWRDYCLLLRRQRAADSLWSWQARVWSDVVAVTLSVALEQWKKNEGGWDVSSFEGTPSIDFEQHQGRRLASDSLPGPYLVKRRQASLSEAAFVLEVVRDDLLRDFAQARRLRGTDVIKAAVTLVLTPLSGKSPLLVPFWPVHTRAEGDPDPQAVRASLERAIRTLKVVCGLHTVGVAVLNTGTPGADFGDEARILRLSPERHAWPANVGLVSSLLEELFERVVSR